MCSLCDSSFFASYFCQTLHLGSFFSSSFKWWLKQMFKTCRFISFFSPVVAKPILFNDIFFSKVLQIKWHLKLERRQFKSIWIKHSFRWSLLWYICTHVWVVTPVQLESAKTMIYKMCNFNWKFKWREKQIPYQ